MGRLDQFLSLLASTYFQVDALPSNLQLVHPNGVIILYSHTCMLSLEEPRILDFDLSRIYEKDHLRQKLHISCLF